MKKWEKAIIKTMLTMSLIILLVSFIVDDGPTIREFREIEGTVTYKQIDESSVEDHYYLFVSTPELAQKYRVDESTFTKYLTGDDIPVYYYVGYKYHEHYTLDNPLT